jgi:copper transport protein
VFIHTSVVAYWVGSLLPLAALLREPGNMAAPALRRFSNTIGPLLLLLVLTGTTIAVVQIRGTQELLDTDYGHVFLAKMVLVAVLLGLGAFNRWGLTGSVLEDAELAKRTLVRSIAFELVLVTLVLAVVALWRFTPPPRALLDAAAQPVLVQLQSSDAMATLTLTPDHPGPVDLSVSLMGPDMARLAAQGLTVDLSNKEKGIEPIERQATLGPDGNWHVAALTLPAAGQWEIELDILISDFKEITLTGSAQVRP